VGVDDVEFVPSELPQHRIERWNGERVVLGPGRLDCEEAMGVRIGVAMAEVRGGEEMNPMPAVTEFLDERVDAHADPIEDRQRTIGEDRDSQRRHHLRAYPQKGEVGSGTFALNGETAGEVSYLV